MATLREPLSALFDGAEAFGWHDGGELVEERFDGLLARAFPAADPLALRRAWRIAATVLFRSLGDLDTAAAHLPEDDPATISAAFVEAVVVFCADGLAAAGRRA